MKSIGKLQDDANEKIKKDIKNVNTRVVDKIFAKLKSFFGKKNIELDTDYLKTIEDKIVNYPKHLGYPEAIEEFKIKFDVVDDEVGEFYSTSRVLLENEAIGNELNEKFRAEVINNLLSQGMMIEYVSYLLDVLRVHALKGLDISNSSDLLKEKLHKVGFEFLNAKVEQITHDAIMQYNGLHNLDFKRKYGLTEFYYIGSIIESSRPICNHLNLSFKGNTISDFELEKILNVYCPNGIPSSEPILYETVNGVKRTLDMGAGMIHGTLVDNFVVFRGGCNCRHETRYTQRGSNSKDTALSIVERIYGKA